MTSVKLNRQQELRLLKNLLAKEYDPQFFIRLRELDPHYANKLEKKNKIEDQIFPEPDVRSCLENVRLPEVYYPLFTMTLPKRFY